MSDRKLVVVPERMILSSEIVEAVAFHCGDGKDNSYGDYQDGLLFIGVLKDDEGRDVYGLHIASGECEEEGYSTLVEFEKPMPDYDALAAQRDEGLAREAELERENRLLRHDCASFLETMAKTCDLLSIDLESAQNAQGKPSDVLYEHAKDLQQRLAEAKRLLLDVRGQLCGPDQRAIDAFLASSGCADGEKAE